MRPRRSALALVLLVAAFGGSIACRGAERRPSITITKVPPAAEGGPDRMADIAGRVEGAQAGDAVVLFARSDRWHVQPYRLRPITTIKADATWAASIHLGSEYAALLVRKGFEPPWTVESLPDAGGDVIDVVRVKGTGEMPTPAVHTVSFSGYDWAVRQVPSERGGLNQYDLRNVRVDTDGALHLSVNERDGVWSSAEVSLTRSLGYGTYAFSVRGGDPLDPAVLLNVHTYDASAPKEYFRELAILIRRPEPGRGAMGQYVVQPNHVAANVAGFAVPVGDVTHSIRWEPGRVVFGTNPGGRPSMDGKGGARHEFTVGVPAAGREQIRVGLCYFRESSSPPRRGAEVIIERFRHFP